MLDRQSVENCLTFLNRTDIKGAEVPAFVDLTNRLHHIRNALVADEAAASAVTPAAPVAPDNTTSE